MIPLLSIRIDYERDVVTARRRGWQLAEMLGFDLRERTQIATSVSEIARNAYGYAGGGRINFTVEGADRERMLVATVADNGPGISNLAEILGGRYRSLTGMGLGIIGARRLMDYFDLQSIPGESTVVRLGKRLPLKSQDLSSRRISELGEELARLAPENEYEVFQQQNRELLGALQELRQRQEELLRLNKELEDTNRGVVALYAELDERAERLRQVDELKSRFLSHMSHEFRTPLNSIMALTRLLIDRTDGDLTDEQELQINFIRRSASDLTEIINDLLDLAKVESGKTDLNIAPFTVEDLFGALRGVLRPLLDESSKSVLLLFENPNEPLVLESDEGKIAQILRNLISNALKFTSDGEVRVSVIPSPDRQWLTFAVVDTGIGIAPEDLHLIFQEFEQIKSSHQKGIKGTGLGLPISRRLAELLGGSLTVRSLLGAGSAFALTVPRRLRGGEERLWEARKSEAINCLVIDDDPSARYIVRRLLGEPTFRLTEAVDGNEGMRLAREMQPDVILLDMMMPGMTGFEVADMLGQDGTTCHIPMIAVTSKSLTTIELQHLALRSIPILSKQELAHEGLISHIYSALAQAGIPLERK